MAVSARSALSGVEKDRPSRIMQQKERKVKPEASCLSRPARGEGTGLGAENAKHVQPCAATGRFPGPPCTAVLAKWYRALGLLWRSTNVHEVPVTWLPPSALVSQRGRVTFTSGALPRARGFKRREPPVSWSASGAGSKKPAHESVPLRIACRPDELLNALFDHLLPDALSLLESAP